MAWTKIAKPVDGGGTVTTTRRGYFTGILGLTHRATKTTTSPGTTWTKIAKPVVQAWTKITKPV